MEFPNPEEGKSALDLAMRKAEESGATYIIANDPDADRLALAQKVKGSVVFLISFSKTVFVSFMLSTLDCEQFRMA